MALRSGILHVCILLIDIDIYSDRLLYAASLPMIVHRYPRSFCNFIHNRCQLSTVDRQLSTLCWDKKKLAV